jgi:hypothetical protein
MESKIACAILLLLAHASVLVEGLEMVLTDFYVNSDGSTSTICRAVI